MNERKKFNKGSITVEASLIISLLLFILSAIIIFTLILYQKVVLVHTASLAAQQGAEVWVDSRKSIENGSWDKNSDKDPLYYQIFNDSLFSSCTPYVETLDLRKGIQAAYKDAVKTTGGDIQSRKIAEIRKIIYKGLTGGVLEPEVTYLKIGFENNLVQRKITVYLEQEIKIPFGALKELFGGKETLTLAAEGVGIVTEPAEYIRNLDFLAEYTQRFTQPFSIDSLIEDVKGKVFR